MKPTTTVLAAGGAIAACALAIVTFANSVVSTAAPKAPDRNLVERGRYLVHNVGMCIDCHSPRNEKGGFIESRYLTGSPLGIEPSVPMPWMPIAPRIAGLPAGFSEENLVSFLMTGERPNNMPPPLPPMPPYRLNRADAEAVAAYLRSLPSEAE
jgi:mono/diheme cytochrome c family protein